VSKGEARQGNTILVKMREKGKSKEEKKDKVRIGKVVKTRVLACLDA
jgi:hypothetical protein